MKRKQIAAANWKMNTTVAEGVNLINELAQNELDADVTIVICPPATHLTSLKASGAEKGIHFASQNMYFKESGAYTGELSPDIIKSTGADHVVIGHSERREYFGETDEILSKKLKLALDSNLTPIFCCGEGLSVRKAGNHVSHVIDQIIASFQLLNAEEVVQLVIAYEPIWAIGTGETASPEQAQEMHAAIRAHLTKTYGSNVANQIPILYGGSVKPANAIDIFKQEDVDGGLVGGASLKADSFTSIINSFPKS